MVHRIRAEARSVAPPGQVFALLADGRTWPRWGMWTGFELALPDPDGGQGVGAIRVFRSRSAGRTISSRERVTQLLQDRVLGYELVSGLPLKGYAATVTLTPDGDGTRIVWESSFRRATPGLSWLYRALLQRFIADAAERLADYAGRLPSD